MFKPAPSIGRRRGGKAAKVIYAGGEGTVILDELLVQAGPEAVKAYYSWIRQRVADNTPWDKFVREIVTAYFFGVRGQINAFTSRATSRAAGSTGCSSPPWHGASGGALRPTPSSPAACRRTRRSWSR